MQSSQEWAKELTISSPGNGARTAWSFVMPTTVDDLLRRGRAFEIVAQHTGGWMGRTPDYVNTELTACAMVPDFFAENRADFGENIVAYHRYARDSDLCITHTFGTPQVDRSSRHSDLRDPFLTLGVVRKTKKGLVVRGARTLATLAPFADELLVLPGFGLQRHPAERPYALAFAIPVATQGLRFVCRETYDLGRTRFDHPLGSRYEEMDAMAVFDDVLVPWDRVFLEGDLDSHNTFFQKTGVWRQVMQQVAVRDLVKCECILGIGALMAQAVGTNEFPLVAVKIGELVDIVELVRSLRRTAEVDAGTGPGQGIYPAAEPLKTLRSIFPRLYARAIELLQLIGASSLINVPAEADLCGPLSQDMAKFYSAKNQSAATRVALFRLAWDATTSSFGGRQLLYERYFNGDSDRTSIARHAGYDLSRATDLVQRLLKDPCDSRARASTHRQKVRTSR